VRSLSSLIVLVALPRTAGVAEDWPQWRGPSLNGINTELDLPFRWSPSERITWKLEMPSKSGATPITWRDAIFLTVAEGGNLWLWRVDNSNGKAVWKQQISGGDYQINKQNMSSPSPVTDGTAVWAMTGVGVIKAFDFAGQELWVRDLQKDYGRFGLNAYARRTTCTRSTSGAGEAVMAAPGAHPAIFLPVCG
jgi:outer membrane protein assembly factor BamB